VSNIYFSDKKRNIIINGDFTKIIYSNQYFTMSCMYFQFSIEPSKLETNANKTMIFFQPYNKNNIISVQEISKLECRIIDYYKKTNGILKQSMNVLSKLLYTGAIKMFDCGNLPTETQNEMAIIVKISGVWETETDVGISYKLYN
jgi:hypothetical protein